jgi:molybdopterin molybdotransferase
MNAANPMSVNSRPALMPLDEALLALLATVEPTQAQENVSTFEADGRVLAQDLVSALDVPGHDNSSMDGYAVRAADVAAALPTGAALPVSQRIPAGHAGTDLLPGTVARIFTGAPVPPGPMPW